MMPNKSFCIEITSEVGEREWNWDATDYLNSSDGWELGLKESS